MKRFRCMMPVLGAAVLYFLVMADAGDAAFDQIKNAPGAVLTNVHIEVKKDGTASIREHYEYSIHSREGIKKYGIYTQQYNPALERYRVLKMETRNGGEVKPVPANLIEDKPVASNLSGFDAINQFKAAFPDVREGSVLVVDIQRTIFRTKLPGLFEYVFKFGGEEHIERAEIEVVSELPLFWEVNDRWDIVDAQQEIGNGVYRVSARNKRSTYFKVVHEEQSLQTDEDLPYLAMSTVKDWRDLGHSMSSLWESRLKSPLPVPFRKIANEISPLASEDAKIDTMLNLVSERLRYHGDWRPVEGTDVPRPLADIGTQGFGDCKDFSAVSVAILRHAGMTAYPVFVERGRHAPTARLIVPRLDAFDHVVVFVRGKDGKSRWFDPTNAFRPSSLIPEDIADRPGLLLAGGSSELVRLPTEDPALNVDESIDLLQDRNDGWVKYSLARRYIGNPAFEVQHRIVFDKIDYASEVEADIKSSGLHIIDFRMLSEVPRKIEKPFEFTSRFSFLVKNFFYRAGENYFHVLEAPPLVHKLLSIDPEKRESSYGGDSVGTDVQEYRLESWRAMGAPPDNCLIDTPWYSIRRAVSMESDVLVVRDTAITKKGVIPVEGLRSEVFTKTIEKMRECFMQVGVIIKKKY
jgi:transglutaminase-like putative cysteine protease